MIVFKNYFKILKKHFGMIIMFVAICTIISTMNTSYTDTKDYENIIPNLAIINNDNSKLSTNFIEFVKSKSNIIDIDNNEKDIQDYLYLNKVDSVLIIPSNFKNDLLDGKDVSIKIKKSTANISKYTEILVNKYCKMVDLYSKSGMSEDEIILKLNENIKKEVNVKVEGNKTKSNIEKLAVFYSFENYAFLSIFIFVIGTIMCIFNKETIKNRNIVSKLNIKSYYLQLFLGHSILTIAVWLLFIIISVIIYKELMFTLNGLLLILNSLCFVITVTSLAYLIGSFIKNINVISGIQNVVSLGLSFISGCFVPMKLLDKNIINFSKIFPSYYFIKGNYDIVKITNFNIETLKPILTNFLIILLFGITYLALVLIFKKNKKRVK